MAAVEELITEHMDVWTSAVKRKSSAGRGGGKKIELYGVKKLRELILDLAVRGLLVPQDAGDEPASVLLERIAAEKAELVKLKKIKKQKTLPEILETDKPFDLPIGWEWIRFSSLPMTYEVGLDRGKALQGESKQYRYFKMNNIANSGGLDLTSLVSVDATSEEVERFRLNINDLLFNTRNSKELVGKTCVFDISSADPFLYNNNILRARFSENPLASILDIWMRSPTGKNQLDALKSGTTNVWAIYQGKLETLICPVPSIIEQHHIVAKVDELMALCDQLEQQSEASLAAHQTLVQTLLDALTQAASQPNTSGPAATQPAANAPTPFEQAWHRIAQHFDTLFTTEHSIELLKQKILHLAIQGKLTDTCAGDTSAQDKLDDPEITSRESSRGKSVTVDLTKAVSQEERNFPIRSTWAWTRLGKVVDVSGGSQPPKSVFIDKPRAGYTRLIQIRDFKSDNFPTYVPDEHAKRPFGKNDIMIGRYGPPVFQILRGKTGTYNVALMKATPVANALSKDYLYYLLSEPNIQKLVVSESERTAGQSGVRKELIYEFPIALPPAQEQQRIVAKIDELMALCDQLKARLADAQNTRLQLADAVTEQAIR